MVERTIVFKKFMFKPAGLGINLLFQDATDGVAGRTVVEVVHARVTIVVEEEDGCDMVKWSW